MYNFTRFKHTFTYSLYPHAGCWTAANTISEAADLNDPVDIVLAESRKSDKGSVGSFVTLDTKGVTLEAVKKSEDSDDVIVRLVERHGGQETVTVSIDEKILSAADCDLMEKQLATLPLQPDGSIRFSINPYEIKTLKLKVRN